MSTHVAGRPPKHPWATYLNGQHHTLEAGIHFPEEMSLENFRTQVIAAAKQRGIVVETHVRSRQGLLTVRALLPENYEHLYDGKQHFVPCKDGMRPWKLAETLSAAAYRAGVDLRFSPRHGGVDIRAVGRLDGTPLVSRYADAPAVAQIEVSSPSTIFEPQPEVAEFEPQVDEDYVKFMTTPSDQLAEMMRDEMTRADPPSDPFGVDSTSREALDRTSVFKD